MTALLPANSDPLEDLTVRWLLGYQGETRTTYARDLRAWVSWCRAHDVEALAAERVHVDAYREHMGKRGLADATIARRLASLSSLYAYGLSCGMVERNPVTGVRRPRGTAQVVSTGISGGELRTLLALAEESSPQDGALVCLLGLNGLRISEVVGIDIEDLGQERGHRVIAVRRKGGKRTTVPLAPATARLVEELASERGSGPLFVTRTGRRLDRTGAWRRLRRMGDTHPHALRHAFVTLALDAGASLRDVQDAAGHADPRTTRRYDQARHNLDRHPTYVVARTVG